MSSSRRSAVSGQSIGKPSPKYGRGAVLEQIAGTHHVRVLRDEDDVVVGMAAAEVAQLNLTATEFDGRPIAEQLVRRVDNHLAELVSHVRHLRDEGSSSLLALRAHERDATLVTPDLARPERMVAEHVIGMPVGVDDDRHRRRLELAQVGLDLVCLAG